jgi:hypothetical protein
MNTQLTSTPLSYRYCGRIFTESELALIRKIIASHQEFPTRAAIAREMCTVLGWLKPDGLPKAMSARVALLRMQEDGLLSLPAPTHSYTPAQRVEFTAVSNPQTEVHCSISELANLTLHRVSTTADSRLWNELVERYHYLGYRPLPGAQVRYIVKHEDTLLAVLGFGAAAWKVAARDSFIGWKAHQRADKLHLVVNNARFLILPWVHVPHLASRILGMVARQVAHDWPQMYGYKPVLLETFVEQGRFSGTCYKAANWICVGQTTGRGKLDRYHRHSLPVKDVYVYPLHRHFRRFLAVKETY